MAQTGMQELARRLREKDRRALARAITLVENGQPGTRELIAALHPSLRNIPVTGFTGPPGVGKSTLVNAFVKHLRERNQTVAVIAIDPSSPLTGGAILGDRIRMGTHTADEGVFIRSLSSRGQSGGLSLACLRTASLMDAAGFDHIIIETVGAGQSETDITALAGIRIVVLAPGLGDDIQAIKAGILEIADILVVNKSDLPNAASTTEQLRAMLKLRRTELGPTPVIETCATSSTGIDMLVKAICDSKKPAALNAGSQALHLLRATVLHHLRQSIMDTANPQLVKLAKDLRSGKLGEYETIRTALSEITRKMGKPD